MQRALELATLGQGKVSPNPLVGCVIVKNHLIIGEGWHKQYGSAHAEVNAIASVQDQDSLLGSEIYVTLEPCAHHGNTPPCAELLSRFKFKKIFVCNRDPNPLVSGKGIAHLTRHGIEVETGVLEKEGLFLNRRFFTRFEKSRPYVILKWAETADGFLAREDRKQTWISNPISRRLVHKWRSEEDAVLIGGKTLIHDNPRLNTRDWTGKDPIRMVVNFSKVDESKFHFFDKSQRTIIFNSREDKQDGNNEYIYLDKQQDMIVTLLHQLHLRHIQSVIVEGGAQLLNLFIQSNKWDEARVFQSKFKFLSGIPAPSIGAPASSFPILDDVLMYFYHELPC